MNMKTVALFLFLLILPEVGSARSKDAWKKYWRFKRQSQTIDNPMDRTLFGLPNGHIMEGAVFDASRGSAIPRARVNIYDDKNTLIGTHYTDNRGDFLFAIAVKKKYRIEVKLAGYARLVRFISGATKSSLISCPIVKTKSAQIRSKYGYAYLNYKGMARLYVPAGILKRIDSKPIKYPVSIEFRYLDPRYDLRFMPGRDMLSVDNGNLQPLLSYGAAIIYGYDAQGVRVIVDREKERKSGRTTRLTIRLPWVKKRSVTKDDMKFSGWQISPGKADWEKAPVKMRPETFFRGESKQSARGGWSEASFTDAVTVRSIELAPFNLDEPTLAVPLMFKIRRLSKNKKFIAVVTTKAKNGYFQIYKFFNNRDWVTMKFLFPAGLRMKLTIYTDKKLKYPVFSKWYSSVGKVVKFKRGKSYSKIVTMSGENPDWELLDKVKIK